MPTAASLERAREIDEYAAAHIAALEDGLSTSINECMTNQPNDPLQFIGMHLLRETSQAMAADGGRATGDTNQSTPMAFDWSAAGWLASLGIDSLLAGALLDVHRHRVLEEHAAAVRARYVGRRHA